MNPTPSPVWKSLRLPLFVAALLLWLFSARFEMPAAPMDEGTLLVYPEQVLKGRLPYRDFETAYGPANPFLLAGLYAITGPGIFAERAMGMLYRALILAAIFALSRRWGTTAAAGAMLLGGMFLLLTNLVAYAWMGGMACLLWAVWAGSPGGNGTRKFMAGFLTAGALLFRADLGLAALLSVGALILQMDRRERRTLAAGFACGLLPLAILTAIVGPLAVYENLFHYAVLKNQRRLPITAEEPWKLILLALHFVSAALAIWHGWRGVRTGADSRRSATLLALGFVALGCSHQALQRFDSAHLCFTCFFSLAILPLAFLSASNPSDDRDFTPAQAGFAVSAVLAVIAFTSPSVVVGMHDAVERALGRSSDIVLYLRMNDRVFPLPTEREFRRTVACVQAVQRDARPGERLFIGSRDLRQANYNDTFLYFLFPQLLPATYFLEMNPGSANRPGSRLTADVASADWLILNSFWDLPELDASARAASTEPEEIVRTQFKRVHAGAGFEVYHRTSPAVVQLGQSSPL